MRSLTTSVIVRSLINAFRFSCRCTLVGSKTDNLRTSGELGVADMVWAKSKTIRCFAAVEQLGAELLAAAKIGEGYGQPWNSSSLHPPWQWVSTAGEGQPKPEGKAGAMPLNETTEQLDQSKSFRPRGHQPRGRHKGPGSQRVLTEEYWRTCSDAAIKTVKASKPHYRTLNLLYIFGAFKW